MNETTSVRRVRRRSPEVDAFHFDGTFPLEFLLDTEIVAKASDSAIVITEDGKVKARANEGQWLIRTEEGDLVVFDGVDFLDAYEEVPPLFEGPRALNEEPHVGDRQ